MAAEYAADYHNDNDARSSPRSENCLGGLRLVGMDGKVISSNKGGRSGEARPMT